MFSGINDKQGTVSEGGISAFYKELETKINTGMSETIERIKSKISEVKTLDSREVNVTYDDIVRGDNKKEYREILKKQMGGLSYFFKFILGFGNKDTIVEIVKNAIKSTQNRINKSFLEKLRSTLLSFNGDLSKSNIGNINADNNKLMVTINKDPKFFIDGMLKSIEGIMESVKRNGYCINEKYLNKIKDFLETLHASQEENSTQKSNTSETGTNGNEKAKPSDKYEQIKSSVKNLIEFCNNEIKGLNSESGGKIQ